MKPNRREMLGVGVAGAAGLIGLAVPREAAAHTGTLTEEEFRYLAFAPQDPGEFLRLARHMRALAKGAEADGRLYTSIGAAYREGLAGTRKVAAMDAARAIEHVAEHNWDSAEALLHLAEAYEALAENFQGIESGA